MQESEYVDEQSIFSFAEFDSMNHMVFITNLEEQFTVELTGDEIVGIKTIKDIKEILKQKGVTDY